MPKPEKITAPDQARLADRRRAAGRVLAELIESDRRRFIRFAATLVRQVDVEDVLQDACAGFIRSFDPSKKPSEPLAYFLVSIRSSAYRLHRFRSRRVAEVELIAGFEPVAADEIGRRDGLEVAREALAGLSGDERLAVALRALGFSTAEIESALGASPRATRKRLEHGRRKLREKFDQ